MAEDFGDGWGEDLDDLIDDDEIGGDTASAQAGQPKATMEGEGWGDDLDNIDVNTSELAFDQPVTKSAPKLNVDPIGQSPGQEEFGWDDDDDIFSDTLEDEPDQGLASTPAQTPTPPPRQQNHRVQEVFQELVSYVESLMILLPSINAVFEAEYNHPGKAEELLHYYRERPQLRDYTIEKELDRMDYQVMIQHADGEEPIVVDNKLEIAQLFKLQNELDLLVRCANQSLLADMLHVMTGQDGLVRPQYMATCLAESCLFVLRCSPGVAGGIVECTSRLVLSLPEPSGNRYPLANLKVHVVLGVPTSPQSPPLIEFKLQSMDIIIPSMDILRPTAQFLVESGLLEHPSMSPFPQSPGGPIEDNDTFRDVFLQQSQSMLQNSTVGLKSAWQQIDSVAGLSNKMNLVQKILPTDSSVFEAAMQEQEAYANQLKAQTHQQGGQGVTPVNLPSDTVPVSYPPPERPQQPQARPTSILGSFMGAIAKSVTLPEEDPSLYEQYTDGKQQGHPQSQTTFPRPVGAAAPAPTPMVQLYRKDNSAVRSQEATTAPAVPKPFQQQPATQTSPWLSQMTQPNPVPPSRTVVPTTSQQSVESLPVHPQQTAATTTELDDDIIEDLGLDDGWGEDIDLALDGEDEQNALEEAKEGTTPPRPTPTGATNTVVDSSKTVVPAKSNVADPAGYSEEDDIVETRKRWMNPRPGPRYLRPVLS